MPRVNRRQHYPAMSTVLSDVTASTSRLTPPVHRYVCFSWPVEARRRGRTHRRHRRSQEVPRRCSLARTRPSAQPRRPGTTCRPRWRTAGESAKDAGKHTADLASAKAAGGRPGEPPAEARRQGGQDRAASWPTRPASRAPSSPTRPPPSSTRPADEAWARANLAANALAGRKPGLPWGLIVGAGLLGVALGWVAATTARAAIERQAENEELELAETAVVVTPTYDN